MLKITVPACEFFDDSTQTFHQTKAQVLSLEHSLVSISKWEAKYNVPFLSDKDMTDEQTLYYIKCMTLTQNVSDIVYKCLTVENIREISEYINAPMSATTVPKMSGNHNRESVTSELIYYWMIELHIPVEFQKWHLNRLLKLIDVCNFKNSPDKKKMSMAQLAEHNRKLNAERKKRLHTTG